MQSRVQTRGSGRRAGNFSYNGRMAMAWSKYLRDLKSLLPLNLCTVPESPVGALVKNGWEIVGGIRGEGTVCRGED